MLTARITDIQHFNVHDGPGFRTIVFFQGCSLKCKWCQNPETISMYARIQFNPGLCIGCGACTDACPTAALKYSEEGFHLDPDKCTLCGACADECYPLARTLSSRERTLDEVFLEVMQEKNAYLISGGGVTLSGGEPLLHPEFVLELLRRVREQGVSTAIETAGLVPTETLDAVIPYTDTFLFDFKLFTPELHREWTGHDNTLILHNLRHTAERHDNVVIRIPLIPSVNDTDEEFTKMMRFAKTLRRVNGVHILPFHNLGSSKYYLLGDSYEMEDYPENNDARIQACKSIAEAAGFRVSIGGTGFVEDKHRMLQLQQNRK